MLLIRAFQSLIFKGIRNASLQESKNDKPNEDDH